MDPSHTSDRENPRPLFPWAQTVEDVITLVKSSERGLTEAEALDRLAQVGPNELRRKRRASAFFVAARQFGSPLVFILLCAAGLTVALDEYIETIVILLAVCVNAGLGFYQEYRAENTLERLEVYMKERARVVRDSGERDIDSTLLVPGDVIRLSLGMRVPADARIISSTDLSVDESFLTGESIPVHKMVDIVSEGAAVTERFNMLFAGALVVEGTALAVVTSTGDATEIGRIASLMRSTPAEHTPLQKALSKLAWIIFSAVIVIVSFLFVLGIRRGEPLLDMLLLSVATAIGAVPEALPIALTVILAVGVERIAKRNAIMRSLAAAETLGSTTVVMTDKTGTLTVARMEVVAVLPTRDLLSEEGSSSEELRTQLLSDAFLATDARVENPHDATAEYRFVGRPIESRIASAALEAGIQVRELSEERRIVLLPFNSTNKFSLVADSNTSHIVALGAPDVLLERSDISKEEYLGLSAKIQELSEKGNRLIGVARLHEGHRKGAHKAHDDMATISGLQFSGVIVLRDPIRREVADAVQSIERYGARVVMLTGDMRGTAMAIGKELGWSITEGNVLTGAEIRQMSDEELSGRLAQTKIFARVTPEDKLRIGRVLVESGQVVAMTGDGVNDAPALRAVSIGVALGSGTDVAKSAADLVLLDDNFQTIVSAIEEGRTIIANIRKTFVYLMSNCLDVVFLIGGSLIYALPLPLTAIQIIWVNFFTGSLPALAFAFERSKDSGSEGEGRDILNRQVQILTLGVGVFTSFLLFVFYAAMLRFGVPLETAHSVLFVSFSTYILCAAFSFKNLYRPIFTYDLFDNTALNYSTALAGALALASITVPWLRDILSLSPISAPWLILIGGWIVVNICIVESAKWIFRPRVRTP